MASMKLDRNLNLDIPPAPLQKGGNTKSGLNSIPIFLVREGGLCFCSSGFNRQRGVSLVRKR